MSAATLCVSNQRSVNHYSNDANNTITKSSSTTATFAIRSASFRNHNNINNNNNNNNNNVADNDWQMRNALNTNGFVAENIYNHVAKQRFYYSCHCSCSFTNVYLPNEKHVAEVVTKVTKHNHVDNNQYDDGGNIWLRKCRFSVFYILLFKIEIFL